MRCQGWSAGDVLEMDGAVCRGRQGRGGEGHAESMDGIRG